MPWASPHRTPHGSESPQSPSGSRRSFSRFQEGGIRQSLRHECRYRHNGTIPQGKLVLPAPYLPKEHIVIQLRAFRGEFPSASRPTVCLTAIPITSLNFHSTSVIVRTCPRCNIVFTNGVLFSPVIRGSFLQVPNIQQVLPSLSAYVIVRSSIAARFHRHR